MNIAIVDDDRREADTLSEKLESRLSSLGYGKSLIHIFQNAEAFLSAWKPGLYELILLDIYMDGLSGIETARKIREQDAEVRLAFCTSSNEFASESYEVNAHYYLLKPFSDTAVSEMLQRMNMDSYELARYITLPDGQNVILRNIVYTEYHNHTVTIYSKKGSHIRTRISQTDFERLLCPYSYFCCCSKGIVVNFYEVAGQSRNFFTMSSGASVSISRRKEPAVLEAYNRFLFDQMRKEMYR